MSTTTYIHKDTGNTHIYIFVYEFVKNGNDPSLLEPKRKEIEKHLSELVYTKLDHMEVVSTEEDFCCFHF